MFWAGTHFCFSIPYLCAYTWAALASPFFLKSKRKSYYTPTKALESFSYYCEVWRIVVSIWLYDCMIYDGYLYMIFLGTNWILVIGWKTCAPASNGMYFYLATLCGYIIFAWNGVRVGIDLCRPFCAGMLWTRIFLAEISDFCHQDWYERSGLSVVVAMWSLRSESDSS